MKEKQNNNDSDNSFDEKELERDIDAMIECSQFIGELIDNKQERRENFQHVLQDKEILLEKINTQSHMLKKRKRGGFNQIIEDTEDTDIFDYDWRNI
jgi:hypothetical protein